ncbi:MAG: heavy-metal-associated domain-containing protein [Bacteriovoracaceae bacterium]|nr:heavy-metal-associated domain-containing protein [Bacteriovoracaceae bacterium]
MYKFKIEQMGCMSCVQYIEVELKELNKAINLKPNLKAKTLEVGTTISKKEVKRVIEDACVR